MSAVDRNDSEEGDDAYASERSSQSSAALVLTIAARYTASAPSRPPQSEVAKRFVGAWRYVGTTIDGKPRPDRGANPKGMIYYTRERRTWQCRSRPTGDAHDGRHGADAEEAKAALDDYVAYFGTYTIDERAGTVTHHRRRACSPATLSRPTCATTSSRAIG